MLWRLIASFFVLTFVLSVSAQATLLDGKTVELTYLFPDDMSLYTGPVNVLVDASVEIDDWPVPDNVFDLDISDTNLYFDYHRPAIWVDAAFNGVRLFDVFGTVPSFTSVLVNPATNLAGFSAANITFNADTIWINWQGLGFDENTVVSLDVNGSSVPEPSTVLLLAAGLALSIRHRRRR